MRSPPPPLPPFGKLCEHCGPHIVPRHSDDPASCSSSRGVSHNAASSSHNNNALLTEMDLSAPSVVDPATGMLLESATAYSFFAACPPLAHRFAPPAATTPPLAPNGAWVPYHRFDDAHQSGTLPSSLCLGAAFVNPETAAYPRKITATRPASDGCVQRLVSKSGGEALNLFGGKLSLSDGSPRRQPSSCRTAKAASPSLNTHSPRTQQLSYDGGCFLGPIKGITSIVSSSPQTVAAKRVMAKAPPGYVGRGNENYLGSPFLLASAASCCYARPPSTGAISPRLMQADDVCGTPSAALAQGDFQLARSTGASMCLTYGSLPANGIQIATFSPAEGLLCGNSGSGAVRRAHDSPAYNKAPQFHPPRPLCSPPPPQFGRPGNQHLSHSRISSNSAPANQGLLPQDSISVCPQIAPLPYQYTGDEGPIETLMPHAFCLPADEDSRTDVFDPAPDQPPVAPKPQGASSDTPLAPSPATPATPSRHQKPQRRHHHAFSPTATPTPLKTKPQHHSSETLRREDTEASQADHEQRTTATPPTAQRHEKRLREPIARPSVAQGILGEPSCAKALAARAPHESVSTLVLDPAMAPECSLGIGFLDPLTRAPDPFI